MRIIVFSIIFTFVLLSKSYYARVEPKDEITIKSAVSGLIIEAKNQMEGSFVDKKEIIHIDDKIDKVELNSTLKSKEFLKETLILTNQMIPELKKVFELKRDYYQRVVKLSTSSKTQKDNAYVAMVSAKSQYFSMVEKSLSLKEQIISLDTKIATLRDKINKKHIIIDGYLYRLYVKSKEYVSIGSTLATVDDLTQAKLVLFMSAEALKDIDKKRVFINDKEANATIDKVWRVSDSKYLSSYKVEILLPPIYKFSSLVKVDFK